MHPNPVLRTAAFAAAGALAAATLTAQSACDAFAPPVRLRAGELFLGEKRLFPSPVFHDVDGDGRLDVVVGDLPGRITFALRQKGRELAFAAEQPLLAASGQPLKFHNW